MAEAGIHIMLRKWSLISGAGIIALATSSQVVVAQTNDTQVAEKSDGNMIIVTARKIEESLQDVPIAITAFTAEQIQEQSINELEDVALLTPGLIFEDYSNGGFGTPTIRGTTQFSITGLEQNVSVFLDNIYIPRQYAFDTGTMNLERIEVVKGPQSALYGANAFAGAINYVSTSRSLTEVSGHGEISASENGGFEMLGSVSAPLVDNVLSMRLSLGYSEFDGDYENNHPDANIDINPGTTGKLGGYEKKSLQVGASFRPIDAVTLDFDYYKFDTSSESRAQYRLTRGNGDTNCSDAILFGFLPVKQLFCGTIPNVPIPGRSGVEGIVVDPRTYGLESDTDLYRVGANVDLSDRLSASYLFGRISGNVFSAGSTDRDPLVITSFGPVSGNVFSFVPAGNFKYDSHEARLQYQGSGGFYAMIGAYLQDGEDLERGAFGIVPFRGLDPLTDFPPGARVTEGLTETDTKAVFGRVAASILNERLTFSAEGRYTDEEKRLTTPTQNFDYEDKYFTPRFGIDFQFTPDNMVYASVARGIKSGGINLSSFPGLLASEQFFGPDTNWTYEIGSKNAFGNGRGIFNIALFLIDWSNLQLPSSPTGAPANTPTIITNLGGAQSKGVEVETNYELFDSLTINGGLAYVDATYDEGTISARIPRAALCDGVICAANGDIGGNDLQRTSKWQWNVGASYNTPITDALNLFGRVDVAGQSKQFASEINTAIIEPRTLVNTRIGVKGDFWSASVWAKNLFNERYVANAFFIANPFQVDYVPTLGNQRRIGATVSFDF